MGHWPPKREFLHVDDLADACAFLLSLAEPPDLVNVGTGTDVSIRELTELVAETVGFKGAIRWDATIPDGTPRKLMDVSRMTGLGWSAASPWPTASAGLSLPSSPNRPPATFAPEPFALPP